MADFVASVRERGNTAPTNAPANNTAPLRSALTANNDSSYVSRESVMRRFLMYFANNQPNEMYDMLSESSQKQISRANFAKEVTKASDMREGLKGDYRLDWIGEERARVIVTRKNLVFKSVSQRTLGITREGSSWRIVW